MTVESASKVLSEAQQTRTRNGNFQSPQIDSVAIATLNVQNADLYAHTQGMSPTGRWRAKVSGQAAGLKLPKP